MNTPRQFVHRPCFPASFASSRYPCPHEGQLKTIFPASDADDPPAPAGRDWGAGAGSGADIGTCTGAAGARSGTGRGVSDRPAVIDGPITGGGAGMWNTVWHDLHRPRFPAMCAANS